MPHISFSELKNWTQCAHYHKLVNIQKLKLFKGNEYTAFGTAIHDLCERTLIEENNGPDPGNYFTHKFLNHVDGLREQGVDLDPKLLDNLNKQGKNLAPLIMPEVKEHFEKYEVVGTEIKLYESMEEIFPHEDGYYFKGFVDAVIKTSDGTYHLIDWKTCSWGWDSKKRSDPIISYQLTLYKHFFAQKYNVDPSKIETYFALLKRTAKKDNVEFFRVTSGPKKTKNALNLLKKSLHNITKGISIKNRLSCKYCEFYKTEHCP